MEETLEFIKNGELITKHVREIKYFVLREQQVVQHDEGLSQLKAKP